MIGELVQVRDGQLYLSMLCAPIDCIYLYYVNVTPLIRNTVSSIFLV